MADREYDLLVYGATGFAGSFVVDEIAARADPALRWAIGGRSEPKLAATLARLRTSPLPEALLPGVVVADALGRPALLKDAVATARVVVNCAGPFKLLGRSVVEACVEAGTDYVDIAGEPLHIEGCMLDFHERAVARGVLVVPASGVDSVPADVGAFCYTVPLLLEKAGDQADDCKVVIESFVRLDPGPAGLCVHVTTLRCALEGLSLSDELRRLREVMPKGSSAVRPMTMKRHGGVFRDSRAGAESPFVTLFRGADPSVVRQSQRLSDLKAIPDGLLGTDRLAYGTYIALGQWDSLFKCMVSGIVCGVLNLTGWGRELVLKYPRVFTFGVFSKEGPTAEQIEGTKFSLSFFAKALKPDGTEIAHIETRASGPEPGYSATSKIVLSAALTLLNDREQLPKGGVLTPAAAFRHSGLIKRLEDCGGVKFESV